MESFSRKKRKWGPNLEQYRQFVLEWVDVLPEAQCKMIRGVFALTNTCVREIMVSLSEIMAAHISTSTEQFRAMVRDTGYSFIPVYEERIDRLTGVVSVMDVLTQEGAEDLRPFVCFAHYVPETKIISELLEELRTTEEHIAIVINEYGGCVGLVTLEDILEQIVGEIGSKHEPAQDTEARGESSWVFYRYQN